MREIYKTSVAGKEWRCDGCDAYEGTVFMRFCRDARRLGKQTSCEDGSEGKGEGRKRATACCGRGDMLDGLAD